MPTNRVILALAAFMCVLPLPAQLTESALAAFRKESRATARDQYALLMAQVDKDGREFRSLVDAAAAAARSLDSGIAALMAASSSGAKEASTRLAGLAVSARSSLPAAPSAPPASAVAFSRLIASSVLASGKAADIASLERAVISLCPSARRPVLEELGALFRSGGVKASIAWIQALSASLCLDPAPLAALSRDTASSLNAAKDAQRLLGRLQAAAAVEADFRARPLSWICPPLASEESPRASIFGNPDSSLAQALADPRPWESLLDPGFSSLARSVCAFLCLLPQSALRSRFADFQPAPWRQAPSFGDGERSDAVLLLASFEAALPTPASPEATVRALPPSPAALEAFAAIAAAPAALDLLSTDGRSRERGLIQSWIASLLSAAGVEGRLVLSPSRMAVAIRNASALPPSLQALSPFLATEADFYLPDGSAFAAPSDARPLLWRWAFLRNGFRGAGS